MTIPSFLELPNASLEDAEVVVVCAPYEGTVSYGKGTAKAPEAILRASLHLETFDEELGFEHEGRLRYCVLPAVTPEENEPVERYLERLSRAVAGSLHRQTGGGRFFLGFGGEHSVSSAFLEGILEDPGEVTVVQIDAHADLREEYHGSRFNHACAMRRILELGVKRLLAIGIRSAEKEEFHLAASDPRIKTWYDHQIESEAGLQKLLDALGRLRGAVYLTIDIDGLEPSLCLGTGTPQPGGLGWRRVLRVLRALICESEHEGKAELLGADICEVVPQPHSRVNEMVAAKLAFKIAGYRFAPGGASPEARSRS